MDGRRAASRDFGHADAAGGQRPRPPSPSLMAFPRRASRQLVLSIREQSSSKRCEPRSTAGRRPGLPPSCSGPTSSTSSSRSGRRRSDSWRRTTLRTRHRARRGRRRTQASRARPPAEAVDRDHAHGGSSRELRRRASLPDLAEDADLPRGGEPVDHHAGRADEISTPVCTSRRPMRRCQKTTSPTPSAPLTTAPTTFHGEGTATRRASARRMNIAPRGPAATGCSRWREKSSSAIRVFVCRASDEIDALPDH